MPQAAGAAAGAPAWTMLTLPETQSRLKPLAKSSATCADDSAIGLHIDIQPTLVERLHADIRLQDGACQTSFGALAYLFE